MDKEWKTAGQSQTQANQKTDKLQATKEQKHMNRPDMHIKTGPACFPQKKTPEETRQDTAYIVFVRSFLATYSAYW